jgi:hypothetical protein
LRVDHIAGDLIAQHLEEDGISEVRVGGGRQVRRGCLQLFRVSEIFFGLCGLAEQKGGLKETRAETLGRTEGEVARKNCGGNDIGIPYLYR